MTLLDELNAAHANVLAVRRDREWIDLAGPDARTFLHNLATNDFKLLALGDGRETFLCNHRARALGHGVVNCVRGEGGDVLRLDVDAGRGEPLFRHLDRHLISEQVELTCPADRAMLTYVGPKATALVASLVQVDVESLGPWRTIAWNLGHVRRNTSLTLPAFDVIASPTTLDLLDDRAPAVPLASAEAWEVLRIDARWPRFGVDVDEDRFVAEVDRTAEAISYTKGCYLGQEPIVMARDRGQVQRRLVRLTLPGNDVPPARIPLVAGSVEVGFVTSAVFDPRVGTTQALGYVQRTALDARTALTLGPSGRPAQVR